MAGASGVYGGQRTIAGIVLLFKPPLETASNVEKLAAQVDAVYLVDNSAGSEQTRLMLQRLPATVSVVLLEQNGNRGVAAGFNAGMRAAFADGHEEVIIFDHDSSITDGFVTAMRAARTAAGETAGVMGPALRSAATGRIYRRESGSGSVSSDVLISSGSSFTRALVERIGLHDEPLFIDYVDHDICLRARAHGFENFKVYDAILDHRFGDSDPVSLLGRRVYLSNYSLTRIFFASRNRVIITRRYGFGRWFWEDFWFTAKAWTKVLLLERQRIAKLREARRGVIAGLAYPARERKW